MSENKYKAKQIAISKGDGKTIDTIQLSKETLDGKYFPNPYYFYYDLQKGWTIRNNSFNAVISTDFNNSNTEERNVSPNYAYFSAPYLWNGSDSIGTINNNDNDKNMAIYGATNKQWLNISSYNYNPLYKDNYYNNNIRSVTGNYKSVNNGNQITSNGDSEIKIELYDKCTKNLDGTYIVSFKMSRQKPINGNNNVLLTLDTYEFSGKTFDKIYLRYVNGKGIELMVRNGKGTSNLLHNNVYAPFDETDRIYTVLITPKTNDSIKKTCVGFYYSDLLGSYNTVDQIDTNNNFIITQSSGIYDFNIKIPALKDAVNFESVYEAYFNSRFTYNNGIEGSLFIDNGAYFKFIGDLMTPTTKVSKEPLQHFYNKGILNGITGNKINLWDKAATNTQPTNVLQTLKSVDGSGSGLDADLLDGKHAASFFDITLSSSSFANATSQGKYTINCNPADSPTPKDTDIDYWTCLVFYNDMLINGKKSITQIAINNMNRQQMYIRNQKDGSWGSWEVIATTYSLAKMQFDGTYYTKYNSISDIVKEIATGTVNNSNKLDGCYSSDFIKDGKDVYSNFDRIPLISGMFRVSRNKLGPIVDTDNNYYWSCIQCRSGHNDIFMQLAFYRGDNSNDFYPTIYIRGVRGSLGLIPSGNVGEKDSNGNYIGYISASEWKKIGNDIDEANNADTVDGYHASDFFNSSMTATDFNNATETGLYYITGTNNAPDADTSNTKYTIWLCVVFKSDKLTYQLALPLGNTGSTYWVPRMFIRNINKYGGSLWHEIWTALSDGSDSGLDADKLDGYHANQLAKTEITTVDTIPYVSGIYNYTTNSIENELVTYQLIVTRSKPSTTSSTYDTVYTAISFKNKKIFVGQLSNDSVVWNEISSSSTTVSPTIPVVTEDPTSPTDGQMWIRSDLL